MKGYVLTVEREIGATPEAIFDVLSDASKHALIDGSGMLQGRWTRRRTGCPGLDLRDGDEDGDVGTRRSTQWSSSSHDRRIAWQTGPKGGWGRVMAGRIWRYVLEPVPRGDPGRESWDITPDHQRVLLKFGDIYSEQDPTGHGADLGPAGRAGHRQPI